MENDLSPSSDQLQILPAIIGDTHREKATSGWLSPLSAPAVCFLTELTITAICGANAD